MSKHWKERPDYEKHLDYMRTHDIGGINIDFKGTKPDSWVYFVRECSFTFQFVNLGQLDEMIEYASQKTHPSTKTFNNGLEHYWQSWKERLPKGLFKGAKREKILAALLKAKIEFEKTAYR